MKPTLLNSRAWQPGAWITVSGIVLSTGHVKKVCTVAQNEAVEITTAAIERMMKP